jgi:hypothetical protein
LAQNAATTNPMSLAAGISQNQAHHLKRESSRENHYSTTTKIDQTQVITTTQKPSTANSRD